MNIWIVNPFDPLPGESFRAGRYAFMAKYLVARGHRVMWWTSDFFHFTKEYRERENDSRDEKGLRIKYIPTPPYKKNVSFARVYNHYMYGKRFETEALREKDTPDIILASFPPIESAAAAIRLARVFRKKIVIDIQDLWPEAFLLVFPFALRPFGKNLLHPLFKRAEYVMDNADGLMAVSADYLELGLCRSKNGKRGLLLHLGVDLQTFDGVGTCEAIPRKKRPGEKWVVYAGTMGKTYDLDTGLTAAYYFKGEGNVKFIFAGDGPELGRLRKRAQVEELTNVVFTGFLKFDEVVHLLRSSDIGLNIYKKDSPQTFPNKVFDYLAAGLPVINSIPGELEKVLKENLAGLSYKGGDIQSLVDTIEYLINNERQGQMMSVNARRLAEQKYDRDKTYPSMISFFEKVLSTS